MGFFEWLQERLQHARRRRLLREVERLRYEIEQEARLTEKEQEPAPPPAAAEGQRRVFALPPPSEPPAASELPAAAAETMTEPSVDLWKPTNRRRAYRYGQYDESVRGEVSRELTPGFLSRNTDVRTLATDEEQLQRYGLPVWKSEVGLAGELGLSLSELRYFATHRRTDRVFHYVCFTIPKRKGGERLIMAPKRKLKELQRRIAVMLVNQLPLSDHAHGFRTGRSIRSAAEPHVGKEVVIKMDLRDFFPSVHFGRVRGLLVAYGYGFYIATTLALLLTESERQPVEVEGELRYVPVGPRVCVQGAPSSPGLCNAICLKMDRRLAGLARNVGFDYTRYADDLTFSGDDPELVSKIVALTRVIAEEEGFQIHPEKTRVLRKGGRQQVVGVVVNEVAGRSRKERRRLRAAIHQLSLQDPGERDPATMRRIAGKLAFFQMLNAEAAAPLRASFSELQHGESP